MTDPKRVCSWLFRNSERKKQSPENKSGITAPTGVGVNRRTSRNLARLPWQYLIMRVSLVKDFFWRIGGLTFSGENVAGQGGTTAVISSSQNPVSGLFPSRGRRFAPSVVTGNKRLTRLFPGESCRPLSRTHAKFPRPRFWFVELIWHHLHLQPCDGYSRQRDREHHVDSHHVRQRSSLRASDAGPNQPLGSSPRLGIVQPRDAAWRKTSNR